MVQYCEGDVKERQDSEGTAESGQARSVPVEFIVLIRGRNCKDTLDRCMRSLHKQTYTNWRALILLDAPTDNSHLVANSYREDGKVYFRMHTEHQGLCKNMYEIIKTAERLMDIDDEAVAAVFDADDKLSKHALETVAKRYAGKPKTLITHGSYVKMSKGRRTKISKPNPRKGNIRKLPWRSSHLKTIKWKVIKQVREDWFKDSKCNWLPAASDLALMFGCIEIAGLKRVAFVKEPIYLWYDHVTRAKVANQKYSEEELRKK